MEPQKETSEMSVYVEPPVADVIPITTGVTPVNSEGMSFDNLNKFYQDVYNFNLCANCKIPTDDFCCGEACYEAYIPE